MQIKNATYHLCSSAKQITTRKSKSTEDTLFGGASHQNEQANSVRPKILFYFGGQPLVPPYNYGLCHEWIIKYVHNPPASTEKKFNGRSAQRKPFRALLLMWYLSSRKMRKAKKEPESYVIIIRSPCGYSLESHKTVGNPRKKPTLPALPNIPGINVTGKSRKPTSSYILGVPGRPPRWIHLRGITNPKPKWHILPSVRTILGPYRWCRPHHVNYCPSYLQATTYKKKKSNQEWDGGAQIWNTPGWRRLKGRQVHVCTRTCLKAYFSMRYYLSEGAASGFVVKTMR